MYNIRLNLRIKKLIIFQNILNILLGMVQKKKIIDKSLATF